MKPKRSWTSGFPVPEKTGAKTDERFTVGVPLAKVITHQLVDAPEILMTSGSQSVWAERFRRLKTRLANLTENAPQVIVVTSPEPGEGKSFVSINLALAIAADKRGEDQEQDEIFRDTVEKMHTSVDRIAELAGQGQSPNGV